MDKLNIGKTMEVVEKGTCSLRNEIRSWNIPFNSLSKHLNGKTKRKKMESASVLIEEENVIIVAWIIGMQECEPSITLQQLKMIIVEFTQTRPTPFKHGMLGKT